MTGRSPRHAGLVAISYAFLLLRRSAASAPELEPESEGGASGGSPCAYAAALDADEVLQRCCEGEHLWREIEAAGGCRAAGRDRCGEAEALCAECGAGRLARPRRPTATSLAENATADAWREGEEGQALSSLSTANLELRCTAPRPINSRCDLQDMGIVLVFFAGVSLLVMSACAVSAFDRGPLVSFLRLTVRRLAGPPSNTMRSRSKRAVMAPPPFEDCVDKMPDMSPEALMFDLCDAGDVSDCSNLGECSDTPDALRVSAADEHTLSPAWLQPCNLEPPPAELLPEPLPGIEREPNLASTGSPASTDALPAGKDLRPGSVDTTSTTASEGDRPGSTFAPNSLKSVAPPAPIELPAQSMSVPGPAAGYWPRRLARVLALRAGFLVIANPAAGLRSLHVVLCGCIALQRSALAVTLEVLGCLLPLAWCALAARPPSTPAGGLPDSVAISRILCFRVPRFYTFAVCTAALEIYSITASAIAVAAVTCDDTSLTRASASVVLYCAGVPVAVARSYSALIALQLQSEFTRAIRRVLPDPSTRYTVSTPTGTGGKLGVQGEELRQRRPPTPQRTDAAALKGACESPGSRAPPALENLDTLHRPPSCPGTPHSARDFPATPQSSASFFSRGLHRGGILPQNKLSFRGLLLLGLMLAVAAATGSVWAVRALQHEDAAEDLPSSCAAAQNATATCVPFEYVGDALWDASMGDLLMGTADTEADCCAGCDALGSCQAWMFESIGRRCRWIRFLEAPCSEDPANLQCRCLTHFGTSFGFKPTSQLVWVRRGE